MKEKHVQDYLHHSRKRRSGTPARYPNSAAKSYYTARAVNALLAAASCFGIVAAAFYLAATF